MLQSFPNIVHLCRITIEKAKTIGYNDEMFKFQIILRGHGLYYQPPFPILGNLK